MILSFVEHVSRRDDEGRKEVIERTIDAARMIAHALEFQMDLLYDLGLSEDEIKNRVYHD